MLTVRDIVVRVGARTLLDGVGFEASPGEIIAVIGPNGAGKTSLLEAVLGLRRTHAGSVHVAGKPLVTFFERARAFAYLPDATELAPELDVRAVVKHALARRARATSLVERLREELGVTSLLDEPCGVLSRGERQRVGLFAALAVDRPVVILDEPFSAFDPLQLQDVFAAVKHVADSGASIVATVHQLGDAGKIADRFLLLAEGRSVAWGDLAALRSEAGLPHGTLEDAFMALLQRRVRAA